MSIKKKKIINASHNDYEWTHIEEYLSSKGYICADPNGDIQVWVDCIDNGRTIHFSSQDLSLSAVATDRLPFEIMCTSGRHYSGMVYTRAATIDQAVAQSRDNACW